MNFAPDNFASTKLDPGKFALDKIIFRNTLLFNTIPGAFTPDKSTPSTKSSLSASVILELIYLIIKIYYYGSKHVDTNGFII